MAKKNDVLEAFERHAQIEADMINSREIVKGMRDKKRSRKQKKQYTCIPVND